jgi:hypothetical protein
LDTYMNPRPELESPAPLGKTRPVNPRRNSRLSSSDLGVLPILVALAAFSLAVLAYFN